MSWLVNYYVNHGRKRVKRGRAARRGGGGPVHHLRLTLQWDPEPKQGLTASLSGFQTADKMCSNAGALSIMCEGVVLAAG